MKFPRLSARPGALLALSVCLLAFAAPAYASGGDKDWKPVDPAQLSMTAPVVDKDADAEAIFWEVKVADEADGGEPRTVLQHYVRIKIFNDRGRESQSKVDILAPKIGGREVKISDIEGRTIKPDGTIVELKKEDIFERTIVKGNGVKVKAKSFAMPAVEPGAIIEYRWREVRGDSLSQYDQLEFSRDIPVQLVTYHIKPISLPYFPYGMRAMNFNCQPPAFQKEKDGYYSTSLTNVPAFREEPYMPPGNAVRPWMLIYYTEDRKLAGEQFWKQYGREVYDGHKSQMKVSDEIKRAAAEATAGAASDEEKLDKIFDYVRAKVKNVGDVSSGFTPDQVEKMKANKTPADTLRRAAGNWHDIDMLFASMALAAGFDARVTKVVDRAENFFDPSFTDSYFFDYRGTENIAVRVGDQWRFYDPGTTYVTRGMLRWQEEGEQVLVSDPKDPQFVNTPISPPDKSVERRTAKFKLSDDGTLEGDVRVEYTGHLAVDMKNRNDQNSPAEREENLKNSYQGRLGGAEITDIKIENVTDPDKPYAYSLHIRVPGYAQRTGKRLFFQPAFFERGRAAMFPTSGRSYNIYFHYPWSEEDHVEIALPEGFALDNADSPAPFTGGQIAGYEPKAMVTKDGRTVVYERKFFFGKGGANSLLFAPGVYPNLKAFFDAVNKQDGHTLAVKQAAATASN
jgi:Domain of Unknown Function with PDB structure (DUF3857)/Transglutaminase-like superfamily